MSTTNKSQERVCPSCIADQKKIMSCFGLLTSWPNGLHSLSKAEFHREGPSFHHTNPSTSLDQQSQIIAKKYSSIKLKGLFFLGGIFFTIHILGARILVSWFIRASEIVAPEIYVFVANA